MKRICGNCVFCLIAYDGERLCSLASNEYGTKDEDDEWIAGRLVHPEDECIYPENSGYLSFRPVEPMVDMARDNPGWCRKPNSGVLLEMQKAHSGGDSTILCSILASVIVGKSDAEVGNICRMEKIKPLGLTPGKIYKVLDEMVDTGRLVRGEDGHYQRAMEGGKNAVTKTTNL